MDYLIHNFSFVNDCKPYTISLDKGAYLFEAWGASGGTGDFGGKGAYIKAIINLQKTTSFYIYVGGKGGDSTQEKSILNGGCNGGGHGGDGWVSSSSSYSYYSGGGGGGATDIRTSSSIESRILVAAGGGGSGGLNNGMTAFRGGYGGDEIGGVGEGYEVTESYRVAATQESGYELFQGQNGRVGGRYSNGAEGGGGGGGGYYGGISPQFEGTESTCGAGGGSSYVNNKLFYSYIMFNGNQTFPSPTGSLETGHSGDGFFRITPTKIKLQPTSIKFPNSFHSKILF